MTYTFTTQAQVRAAFWDNLATMAAPMRELTTPGGQSRQHRFADDMLQYKGRRQNKCPAGLRMAWCDYVEMLSRSGEISQALAQRVTL